VCVKERDLSIAAEVRQAVTAVGEAQVQLAIERESEAIARRTRDLVLREFEEGQTAVTRMNEVQRDQVQAEARLAERARPLRVTFHRAFDVCRDPMAALEELVDIGVDRIPTSGQAPSVPLGIERIAELVARAGDRIIIMPGAGITLQNARAMAHRSGAREIHVGDPTWETVQSAMDFRTDRIYMGQPDGPPGRKDAPSPSPSDRVPSPSSGRANRASSASIRSGRRTRASRPSRSNDSSSSSRRMAR